MIARPRKVGAASGRLRRVALASLAVWLLAGGMAMDGSSVSRAADIAIVSRDAWGAKPAVDARMKRHTPQAIIIHHTSVRQQPKVSLERKMRGLQGFSQREGRVAGRRKPAWGDVPYHYYIGVSGRVAEGRSLDFAGDTNTPYDTQGYIQVVVEGDFTKEKPSDGQVLALRALVAELKSRFNIPGARISGHNDHASTDCPGPHLKKHIPSLR